MTCPICARETHAKYRPFCSRRCADVDLGHWLTGKYVLPLQDDADPGDHATDASAVPDKPQ